MQKLPSEPRKTFAKGITVAALYARTVLCLNYSSASHTFGTFPHKGRPITIIVSAIDGMIYKILWKSTDFLPVA